MIQVEGLRKQYGELVAVAEATFHASAGEIFGLLGPNGAGKSTTIGCMSGLLTPTSGHVRILGHDIVADRRAASRVLGVVPQEIALYEDLTAEENLDYWGGVQGLRRPHLRRKVREALDLAGLADRAREPVKRFSGGMKRRLNFACGVVHSPQVILLDEPTAGVDPQSRIRLLDLVREQARGGACVLYTTHYLEEAETLCDRLAILDHGRIVTQGTLAELRAMAGERDLLRLTGSFPEAPVREAFRAEDGVEILAVEEGQLLLAVQDASHRLPALFTRLAAAGAEVRGTTLTQPSLETLFLKLTGKELRE
jgi:ABC-2 type transport system ATP-binding protein